MVSMLLQVVMTEIYGQTGIKMKIIFFLLLTELIFSQGLTGHYSDLVKKRGTPAPTYQDTLFASSGTALTCCDNTIFTTSGGNKVHNGNDITPSANRMVKRVSFYVGTVDGNISAVDFVAEIWTMGATNLTDSLVSSSTITGLSASSWNVFTFTDWFQLTSGTKYAILMARADHSLDDTNNPDFTYGDNQWSTGETAKSYYWTLAGARIWDYDGEWSIRLYGDAAP